MFTHVCFERVWLVPESFEVLEWVGGAIFASRLAKALQGWQSAQSQGLWPDFVFFSLGHAHKHIHIHTPTHAHTCRRTHTHTLTRDTLTDTHTCMRTRTHTHKRTQAQQHVGAHTQIARSGNSCHAMSCHVVTDANGRRRVQSKA